MIKKYSYQFEAIQDDVVVEYPDGDVFLRERNYVKIYTEHETNCTLVSVTIAGKEIRFNYDLLKPITFDVSPYYAKGATSIAVSVKYNDATDTFTIPLSITAFDCYSPFLEFVPERCGDAPYARIVPPNRMLWDSKKNTTSMLSAVRDDDYFSGYEYEMEGVPYATYRPSDAWLTTAQKNAHLGETYRNTLPATGNLAKLDGNGLPLWIEQGALLQNVGATFGEQRVEEKKYCRTKTLFVNYNGLTIEATPDGYRYYIFYYDKNKTYKGRDTARKDKITLNNAATFPYISLIFDKYDGKVQYDFTPSDLVGITSSALTNPEAGKSYRWAYYLGEFQWVELTKEQIINNKFYWSVNSKNYSGDVVNNAFTFDKTFDARLIRAHNISPIYNEYFTVQSVKRVVSLADGGLPYVYIRWKTPWGVSVEHLFYLGTYSSDKADAKELESLNYYEELSNHVRVGSFYLDGIVQPYDLFYYKTLENAELVEMYFPAYALKPSTYMPNGDDYVAIKVKGSDVADAVVEGVAQRIITFKFELS